MRPSGAAAHHPGGEVSATPTDPAPPPTMPRRTALGPLTPAHRRLLVGIGLALLAVVIGWRLTPGGLVLGGDSITYLGVSNNIVDGKGITAPFVNEWDEIPPERSVAVAGHTPSMLWPPGYPVAIAAGTLLGLTVSESARWLSVLGFAVLVVGAGWVASRLAFGSAAAMLAAGLFVAFSPPVHLMVTLAYSDLWAAALSTLTVVALLRALEGKPAWLAGVWTLAAATALTRIGGGAVIVVAAAAVALWYPADLKRRFAAAAAVATALLPLIAWRLHVASELGGTPATFSYHARWDSVTATPGLILRYLVPDQVVEGPWRAVALTAMLGLGALVVLRVGSRRRDRGWPGPIVAVMPRRVILAVALGYVASTILAAFFFGALLTVDDRTYLSFVPLLIALMVGLAAGLIRPPERADIPEPAESPDPGRALAARPWQPAGAIVVVAVLVVLTAQVATGWSLSVTHLVPPPTHALGTPDDLAFTETLAHYGLLFSNSPSQLYLETGLSSITPPTLIRPSTLERNPLHDAQLEDMGAIMRQYNSAFVYYLSEGVFGPRTFLDGPHIAARLGLEQVGTSTTRPAIVFAPKRAV